MIIDCISDLHGHYPKLEGGDLLIVAGDWTARDTEPQCFEFFDWVYEQEYKKKIVVAGNHDVRAEEEKYRGPIGVVEGEFDYLCDSGTEFEGLKIWGSPWSLKFEGMNTKCMAFCVDTEQELADKFSLIPEDTDILITHTPPYGICDEVARGDKWDNCGSKSLLSKVRAIRPRLHVFGHVHEGYGEWIDEGEPEDNDIRFVNASHVNARYQPVNKPIRVVL